MPGCRYMEEISVATMLATKMLAGVIPEVNFRECVTCMPPPSPNKGALSEFEIQRRHYESPKRVLVAPQKGFMCSKNFWRVLLSVPFSHTPDSSTPLSGSFKVV